MYEQPDPSAEAVRAQDYQEEQQADTVNLLKQRELATRKARAEADKEELALRRINVRSGDSFRTRATHWLWRDRIPTSGLSLIAGKGETSKSTLMCTMAGWITTGTMKGEYFGTPRSVIYVVNEDSIEETVIPRIEVNGGDVARIKFADVSSPLLGDGMSLSLPMDIDILRKAIIEHDAAAVFIDPLSANTTGRKNDQGEMRSTYQAVNNLGIEMRVAIVGLAHTRKDAGTGDIAANVMGSSEQTNVCRSLHGLVLDDKHDGARILSCEKLNVGNRFALPSLRFELESTPYENSTGEIGYHPLIKWLQETDETASDVLADQLSGGGSKVEICAQDLRRYVMTHGGQCRATDAMQTPELRKYNDMMLSRARKKAGIKSRREADHWVWFIAP